MRPIVRAQPALEPTTLNLDGYWRSYAGSPHAGTASAGSSGSRSRSEATDPPAVGAALNGHASADADGIDDILVWSANANTFTNDLSFSGWWLGQVNFANGPNLAGAYLEDMIWSDDSGLMGLTFSTSGVGLYRYDAFSQFGNCVRAPAPTGEPILVTYRWDGTRNELAVGVDGPPNYSRFTRPEDLSLSVRGMRSFHNFSVGTESLDCNEWEAAITKQLITDGQFRALMRALNKRYELSLTESRTYEAGKHFVAGGSPDGHTYTGTTITEAAAFSQRDGAKLRYIPATGKWWLFGGWHSSGVAEWNGEQTTNEVWSSVDLETWTLELAHDSNPPTGGAGARPFPRHTAAEAWDGTYWYIIGTDQYHPDKQDVWRTADGVTWTRMCAVAPWGNRVQMTAGFLGSTLHAVGGLSMAAGVFYEATPHHFVSDDSGATWRQLPNAPFRRATIGRLLEFDGLLLVIGGNASFSASDADYRNDTWAFDGTNWRRQSSRAPWSGRLWIDTVLYDGRIWALAGRESTSVDANGAWWSLDAGVTWTAVVGAPWPVSHADGVDATDDEGIIMASGFGTNQSVYRLKVNP